MLLPEGPTPERLLRIIDELSEFVEPGTVPFPLKGDEVFVDSVQARAYVKKKRDGLDVMHANGTIDEVEMIVARAFQKIFEQANQVRMGGVTLEMTSGGGMSVEDWVNRKNNAVFQMRKMLEVAGSGTRAALAVYHIAGLGYSLRRMESEFGQTRDFWRGVFTAGLQAISQHYMQGRRKQRQ